jgi:hypothetical protein
MTPATKENLQSVASIIYNLAAIVSFVKLTFFDDYTYTWWNWIIALPVNAFLSGIWPIYWLILRPLFQ